ncbi:MAG TPA: hypothetical protein V6C58_18785 [Allocoleopsis sp.]
MRKLIVFMSTGYAGMDEAAALLVDDDISEAEIDDIMYQMAVEHAESYGIYPYDEYCDTEDMSEEDLSDSIDAYYEEYDPEKHDQYRPGGGSFEEDFKDQ